MQRETEQPGRRLKAEVWGRLGVTSLHWDKDVEGEKAKTLLVAGTGGHHSQA